MSRRSGLARLVVFAWLLGIGPRGVVAQNPPGNWPRHVDPRQRFEFAYPPAAGPIERGTDNGYGHRAVSWRLAGWTGLGGELVLTTGFVLVDVQALGGLYDGFTLDLVTEGDRQTLLKALPPVTAVNFCAVAASADHVSGLSLPARLDSLARKIDAMRNGTPVLHRCTSADGVLVFHKEATFASAQAAPRQHLYGAVRFLEAPYSSIQIVRGGLIAPSAADLDAAAAIVRSFVAR